jgi:hypothetical protein
LHVDGAAYLTASDENNLNIRTLEGEIRATADDNEQFLLPNTGFDFSDGDFSDTERSSSNDLVPIMIDVLLNGQRVGAALDAFQPDIDAENADTLLDPIACEVGNSATINLDYARPLDFDSTITAESDGSISIVLVNQGTAWIHCNREGEFEGLIIVTYTDGSQATIGLIVTATPPTEDNDENDEEQTEADD